MLDRFPVLEPGCIIHLTPKGGTFATGPYRLELGPDLTDFLVGCDGSRRVLDLIPTAWREPGGDVQLLTFVARMLSDNRLRLSPEPSPRRISVTGSRSANYPPHMMIELTAGCNLACRHCYRSSDISTNQYMPTEDLFGILSRMIGVGLRGVELTGGEPLLHKDFAKIFDFCTDHLDHVAVLTNGTILSDALTDRFAAVAGKLLMSISLDGSTAEAHDFRRGVKGSFQRTCRNLERLATLGIRIRVAMSVDEDNYDDVENTLLLARRLGAFAFSYQPVMPIGRGKEWAPLQWSLDVHQVILSETRLREQYADFLSIMPKEKVSDLERGKNCGAGHRVYTIDPWGNIRPCATFGTEQLVIGNLREQSVEEVFSNPLTR
jgi:MoaA/NifB/PqqE/SkfB family radical SAM enzyme